MYRDNRLNHIHEGTHAIHGIDILGRKVRMHNGAALNVLLSEINNTITQARQNEVFSVYAGALQMSLKTLEKTTRLVLACENKSLALANATVYLDAMGHIVVAWLWLWQALTAEEGLQTAIDKDLEFYKGKLAACRFFFKYELPRVESQLDLVGQLDYTCLSLNKEAFIGA